MSDVYADGIGNVRVAGTNVRIDLLIVGPETDDDGKPVLQKKGELIMPLQGLIRADAQIKNVLNQLADKGVLKKKEENSKDKVSKNEAQVVAGQTLKERQDYYLKLSAKNEHTEDSIQEFYNTLKTGGSEITYNGAVLQQIRKMKSISINELAQITCIRGAYLKAIEEEDFSKFTSEIYLKGYLLCYAESMNLPTEKVLDDYIRVYKNSARSENG